MNKDQIKGIAILAMTLNHIAHVFAIKGILQTILIQIGYFTAPVMCYFLVEGFFYTKHRFQYGLRLFGFALVSQIPFTLAFFESSFQSSIFQNLNMLFTLFTCFMLLVLMESRQSIFVKVFGGIGLILLTGFMDWPWIAGCGVLTFYFTRNYPKRKWLGFVVMMLVYPVLYLPYFLQVPWDVLFPEITLQCIPISIAMICICWGYHGKQNQKYHHFLQYFFYAYYPFHLTVLWLIKGYIG